MAANEEEQLLHSAALKNAKSILLARQRAEHELLQAKEALERRTSELAQSLSLVRATLESTGDGILATDQYGRVSESNRKFSQMWSIPPGEEMREHRQILETIASQLQDPRRFIRGVAEILEATPEERMDVLELADGRIIEQYTRVREIEGSVVGRVWSYRDITASARSRAELREAKEAAEAANLAKSEFLAVMSHELRTPLNAIGGYAELIAMGLRGPVTDQQQEDLLRIQRSQRHLLGLINEVLNYARIETGTVHYDLVDVKMNEALLHAESLIVPQVWEKRLTLRVRECPTPVSARADPEKLRQILLNLLSNAIKFTLVGGTIDVSCETAPSVVTVRVSDTGIGIPEDKLAAIFEPFVQVRSDFTRTSEGTGLGLAISRDLARGMGGDLTVSSVMGGGSVFMLVLPRSEEG